MRGLTLAIESCGAGYGVALVDREGGVVATRRGGEARASAGLLPLVATVMDSTASTWPDVDLIAVVDGPGSYTGLRVGLSTAKGLALALGLEVVGVDALEALAYARGPFSAGAVAAVPAGRGRVYAGRLRWEGERPRLVEGPTVAETASLGRIGADQPDLVRLGVLAAGGEPQVVDPVAVARLGQRLAVAGQAVPPERLLPRYASEPRLGPAPKSVGRRG